MEYVRYGPRNCALYTTEKFGMNHENDYSRSYYRRMPVRGLRSNQAKPFPFIHMYFLLSPWQRTSCGPKVVDTVAEKERRNRGTADTNSRNHDMRAKDVASANAESRAVTLPTFFPPGFLEV
jgi:hypothetical protein